MKINTPNIVTKSKQTRNDIYQEWDISMFGVDDIRVEKKVSGYTLSFALSSDKNGGLLDTADDWNAYQKEIDRISKRIPSIYQPERNTNPRIPYDVIVNKKFGRLLKPLNEIKINNPRPLRATGPDEYGLYDLQTIDGQSLGDEWSRYDNNNYFIGRIGNFTNPDVNQTKRILDANRIKYRTDEEADGTYFYLERNIVKFYDEPQR